MWPLEFDRVAPSRALLTRTKRESKTREARHDSSSHRASSCPSWARTRTLLIQSQARYETLLHEEATAVRRLNPSWSREKKGGCVRKCARTAPLCVTLAQFTAAFHDCQHRLFVRPLVAGSE